MINYDGKGEVYPFSLYWGIVTLVNHDQIMNHPSSYFQPPIGNNRSMVLKLQINDLEAIYILCQYCNKYT